MLYKGKHQEACRWEIRQIMEIIHNQRTYHYPQQSTLLTNTCIYVNPHSLLEDTPHIVFFDKQCLASDLNSTQTIIHEKQFISMYNVHVQKY